MRRGIRGALALGAVVAIAAALHAQPPAKSGPLPLAGDLGVHDPALVAGGDGQSWYVFGTGDGRVNEGTISIHASADGRYWERVGTVWDTKPEWVVEEVPRADNLWAPEVYHDPDAGRYYLYYTASTFGSQRSLIGLATNPTLDPADPDYEWVDQGRSGSRGAVTTTTRSRRPTCWRGTGGSTCSSPSAAAAGAPAARTRSRSDAPSGWSGPISTGTGYRCSRAVAR